MNSMRAKPTPSLGSNEVLNATSGLPMLTIRCVAGRPRLDRSVVVFSNGMRPAYTWPTSPSAQETVTSSPVRIDSVALSQPTTAGMPSSRATMAAWQVRPPRLVTTAAAIFITVPQSGMVASATRISPA